MWCPALQGHTGHGQQVMRGKLPVKGPALARRSSPPEAGGLLPTRPWGRTTDTGEKSGNIPEYPPYTKWLLGTPRK